LNGELNGDKRTRIENLRISVLGWHLGERTTPLAWELYRGKPRANGNRYFVMMRHRVGKFLREHPSGLWGDTLGDPGDTVKNALNNLAKAVGWRHDDVERHLRCAVFDRACETNTVSPDCIAIQLEPHDVDGQVQVTYYPANEAADECAFLSPWILTPRMICAPTVMSGQSQVSDCGSYAISGFQDVATKLSIRLRVPIKTRQGRRSTISAKYQHRTKPC
jgi:hypothetical protein